ncbi:hypothetical protein PG999_000698 [Apiospora kogelbergensis]|uniref:Uncharacterized protein n=1 Tax=Apiospora kogelbergensis TaxID=1337665 RepID=A0AAW0RC96_9PEZI
MMADLHCPNNLPAEVVEGVISFLEQTHMSLDNDSVITTIRKIVADELWAGHRIDVSSADCDFVMRNDSMDYELVHDEHGVGFFQNASYRVPLITIAPGEREQDVLRVGNVDGGWWGHYVSPPLRTNKGVGDYLAFMFVLDQDGEKRKYLFPPLKALQFHVTPTGESCWLVVNVPQKQEFEELRREAGNYERKYNGSIEESAKPAEEEIVCTEDMISRIETWLADIEIADRPEGGRRRRGYRSGPSLGWGNGRSLYEPEEKPRNQGRRGGRRGNRTAPRANMRQPAIREHNASPAQPVVRQILRRPIDP